MVIEAKIIKALPKLEKLKAISSITIDENTIHEIKTLDTAIGFGVVMPNRKSPTGITTRSTQSTPFQEQI